MLFEQVKEYLKTICDHMCKNDTVRTNQNLKENTLCQMPDVPARCSNGSLLSPCSMAVDTSDECYADPGAYKKEHNRNIVPITDLMPCEQGIVAFLRGDKKVVQRLSDLGLTLHTKIELLRKAPMNGPIEICVRRTNLAIAREIADNIFVNIAE